MLRIKSLFERILLSVGKESVKQITTQQSQIISQPKKRSYYACASSRVGPAIFFNWEDCKKQAQVNKYPISLFKALNYFRGLIISTKNFYL